jgi:hypothetical protein
VPRLTFMARLGSLCFGQLPLYRLNTERIGPLSRIIKRQSLVCRKHAGTMCALSTVHGAAAPFRFKPPEGSAASSETVFTQSKFRKNCGEGVANHAQTLLDLRTLWPQKRIPLELASK